MRACGALNVNSLCQLLRKSPQPPSRSVNRELDAVALDDAGDPIAVASCKWTDGPMPTAELQRLEALAAHLRPDGKRPVLYFFSRSGFEEQLREVAAADPNLRLITPEQMPIT